MIAVLGGALAACSPLVTYAPRAGECPARPSGCPFDILADTSTRPYQVIGSIELAAFDVRSIPKDEAALRTLIGPEVCRRGGDAVVPGTNEDGRYLVATVVRWLDVSEPPSTCGKTRSDGGLVGDGGTNAVPPPPQSDATSEPSDGRTSTPPSSHAPMSKVAHR